MLTFSLTGLVFLFLAFSVVDTILGWLLDLVRPTVEDKIQSIRKRVKHPERPPGGKPVRFTCTSPEAQYAEEVYVAGTFNEWLRADEGLIRPYTWQREAYALEKQVREGKVIWEKDIWLRPGYHEFKFVVGKRYWIEWYEGSGYPRGNDAPGGPNFKIVVEP